MRFLALILLALLLPSPLAAKDFNIKDYVFEEFYVSKKPDNESFSKLKHGVIIGDRKSYERAIKAGNPRFCGKYAVLDYGSAHDGPIYYINASDGSMFSVCGMSCDGREKDSSICRQCPPKDLECGGTCPTLTCSIRNNDVEAAKRLIAEKADVREIIPPGQPLLQFAVFHHRPEILKLLIDAGADVNARDKEGRTALGTAVAIPYEDTIRILIDAGANPNAKAKIFNDTISPIEYAEQHKWEKVVSILKKRPD